MPEAFCSHCGALRTSREPVCSACGGALDTGGTTAKVAAVDFSRSHRAAPQRMLVLVALLVVVLALLAFVLVG